MKDSFLNQKCFKEWSRYIESSLHLTVNINLHSCIKFNITLYLSQGSFPFFENKSA